VPNDPTTDPRVEYANAALRYFDTGNWAQQSGLIAGMAARLADAVRGLLEVIDEMQPGQPDS
jgi:hypothetical protein